MSAAIRITGALVLGLALAQPALARGDAQAGKAKAAQVCQRL